MFKYSWISGMAQTVICHLPKVLLCLTLLEGTAANNGTNIALGMNAFFLRSLNNVSLDFKPY